MLAPSSVSLMATTWSMSAKDATAACVKAAALAISRAISGLPGMFAADEGRKGEDIVREGEAA